MDAIIFFTMVIAILMSYIDNLFNDHMVTPKLYHYAKQICEQNNGLKYVTANDDGFGNNVEIFCNNGLSQELSQKEIK